MTAPRKGILSAGNGEEVASPGGGGRTGRDREDTHSLCPPPCPSYLLQVPGVVSHGRVRQLSSGGPQPTSCYTEVGAADSDLE